MVGYLSNAPSDPFAHYYHAAGFSSENELFCMYLPVPVILPDLRSSFVRVRCFTEVPTRQSSPWASPTCDICILAIMSRTHNAVHVTNHGSYDVGDVVCVRVRSNNRIRGSYVAPRCIYLHRPVRRSGTWLVTICGVLASFLLTPVLYNTTVLIKKEKEPRNL